MATTVADVMTASPGTVDRQDSARDAARLMADNGTGDVIVTDNSTLVGILTDWDIAVRLVAQDKPTSTPVAEIVSDSAIETVEPGTLLDDAVEIMRARSVRGCRSSRRGASSAS
jgi:CBS domain-containing protein